MSTARERILGRVRDALRTPSIRPPAPTDAPLFPPVADLFQRFCNEFTALRGELVPAGEPLRAFLAGFTCISTDGGELVRAHTGTADADVREADLGVTGCECLIAQLGAIVVSPLSAGGRARSVLPPAHLVLARRGQIVPDLAAALDLVRCRHDGRWPSTLSIIAGPSRTGDIEKILVLGAHGPKHLALCFVDEPPVMHPRASASLASEVENVSLPPSG